MEQRNLILAIVVSVAILLGFELLYIGPMRDAEQAQPTQEEAADPTLPEAREPGADGAVPGGIPSQAAAPDRDELVSEAPRVAIQSPKVEGSISLVGGRVDDLTLRNYRVDLADDSPNIDLLSPAGSQQAYYADFGWVGVEGDATLPGRDAVWEADGDVLAPGRDVTLSWSNDDGVTFERVYAIDEDYLFTVTQRVVNESENAMSLAPYGLISRHQTPDTMGFWILHEGPLGVFDGTLNEVSYSSLRDDGTIAESTTGGWLGITDKYWLVSLVPEQTQRVDTRFVHTTEGGSDRYQADMLYEGVRLQPGGTTEQTSFLFAGAKEVSVLDRYRDDYGFTNFDRAVDFGWFYFLTKPLFQVLDYFAKMTGNFGVAILILVVLIKIAFFPLANKSFKSMAKMRKLQPEMLKIRERFSDDRQRMNQEMMALYKREGANPASGCLPILIQIPVFFALYKVLFVTIEMRHAPFFGWIQDLSAQDPTSVLNLFGILPWGVPELGILNVINIGILPVIMGVTMYVQFLLNPQPPDPLQARIFKMMPIIFTFLLAQFPAGLVLYWTWNNLLTIAQQYVIMRRMGMQIGGKMPSMSASTDSDDAKKDDTATGDAKADGTSGESAEGESRDDADGPREEQTGGGKEPELAAAGANGGAKSAGGKSRNPAAKNRSKGRGSAKGRKSRKR